MGLANTRGNNLLLELYRFGGNKPAFILSGLALLLGLVTLFGALTLDDKPGCIPVSAGSGHPTTPGKVIVGQIVEREERLDGCKMLAIRVEGHSVEKFVANQTAYNAASTNPEASTVLVLRDLPARYNGLQNGTKLIALYNEAQELPLAFYFPDTNAGLDLGSDTRTDYGKTRLMLYLGAGLLLFIGLAILIIAWRYPVRWNPPPREARSAATPRPKPPKRPAADPITGERYDEAPRRPRFNVKSEPLPPGAEDDLP